MPIVIVGAGLAGLACALRLREAGREVLVLEASLRAGGRIGSVRTPDGFVIDRGFQVLFPSYPSVKALFDLGALHLRPFDSGALVRLGDRTYEVADPLRHPNDAWATALAPFLSPGDAWRALKLSLDVASLPAERLLGGAELGTTDAYVKRLGFSEGFVERFLRPFFGGVFLNRDLANDACIFRFFWKMLSVGGACVPEHGMQALPDQLVARLGLERLRFGAADAALTRAPDGRVTGVTLHSGEQVSAEAVVLATPYPETARLAGLARELRGNAASTLYFDVPVSLMPSRKILLNGARDALVNQVCQLDNVSRAYAPAGRHLVALQVLGAPESDDLALAEACLAEIGPWFPHHAFDRWRLIEVVRTPYGQFREEPAVMRELPLPELAPGLYLASEALVQSSIEGALSGGRLAAEALLSAEKKPAPTLG